jgi:hypothetical protein
MKNGDAANPKNDTEMILIGASASMDKMWPNSLKPIIRIEDHKEVIDVVVSKKRIERKIKGYSLEEEIKIAEECGLEISQPKGFGLGTVFVVIGKPVVDWFLNIIGTALENELKKYNSVYGGTIFTSKFYNEVGTDRVSFNCFRLTRIKPNGDLALDFLGQIIITDDAIKVRPLRLFFKSPKAKNGKEFGLAISINIESVWRQNNLGKKEGVFNYIIWKDKWEISRRNDDANGLDVVKYLKKDWKYYERLPLVPYSTNIDKDEPGGNATISVTVAEIGKPNWIIKNISKLFNKNKDKIGDLIENAVKEAQK